MCTRGLRSCSNFSRPMHPPRWDRRAFPPVIQPDYSRPQVRASSKSITSVYSLSWRPCLHPGKTFHRPGSFLFFNNPAPLTRNLASPRALPAGFLSALNVLRFGVGAAEVPQFGRLVSCASPPFPPDVLSIPLPLLRAAVTPSSKAGEAIVFCVFPYDSDPSGCILLPSPNLFLPPIPDSTAIARSLRTGLEGGNSVLSLSGGAAFVSTFLHNERSCSALSPYERSFHGL